MTPLDEQLGQLRADLRSRIAVPPLTSVVSPRVARRRSRLGAALAAVGVVAALTTGALVTRAGHHPDPPAAPRPTSVATGQLAQPPTIGRLTSTAPSSSSTSGVRSLLTVDMADARHGFALYQSCSDGEPECRVTAMAATQDGRRWVDHAVPAKGAGAATEGNGAPSPALVALGPRSVLYQAAPSGPGSAFFSSDAGATWTAVPPGVSGTVAAIPAGGVLQAFCPTGGYPCPTIALTVRLPSNGHLVKLAHQPDLAVESANAAPLSDGSWWVAGTTWVAGAKSGQRAFAVSRDQGRTWTTSTMPVVSGQYLYTTPVTGDHGRLWALVIGELPEVKNGLLGIYRSNDNGRTWSVAWTAKAGKLPRSALGVALASGSQAVICDESLPQRGWRSTDGGRTFRQVDCPTAGFTLWTRAGYLGSDGSAVSLSPDGVSWTRLTP